MVVPDDGYLGEAGEERASGKVAEGKDCRMKADFVCIPFKSNNISRPVK